MLSKHQISGKISKHTLSIEEKIEVLNYARSHPSESCRKLSLKFAVGKTQISNLLKNEAKVRQTYAEFRGTNKSARSGKYHEINEVLYTWYNLARESLVPVNGPMLQEEALEISKRLDSANFEQFKASNGWLEKWKARYGIVNRLVEGESGEVQEQTIESWMERLREICIGYRLQDIWNMDETGCFSRALPDKTFSERGKRCKGGKSSKQRVTVAFFVNAAGGKESDPVVIWRSKAPRCFKSLRDKTRPANVHYFTNQKPWMTSDIMRNILACTNRKLKSECRNVLLFLDNAPCYPSGLSFSNIKVIFLPKNATSRLQPLDAGIIQNFKVKYRKLLLKFVISRVDKQTTAAEIAKEVDILKAIRWIQEAWVSVREYTVRNCFQKCGFTDETCAEVDTNDEEFASLVKEINFEDPELILKTSLL